MRRRLHPRLRLGLLDDDANRRDREAPDADGADGVRLQHLQPLRVLVVQEALDIGNVGGGCFLGIEAGGASALVDEVWEAVPELDDAGEVAVVHLAVAEPDVQLLQEWDDLGGAPADVVGWEAG